MSDDDTSPKSEEDNTLMFSHEDQHPEGPANVASLSRKLPGFWKNDPVLWFIQIEAVFGTARITQSLTRFHYVISVLDLEVLAQVSDIVKNPGNSPYESIKARLIQLYKDTEHARITKLLESTQLGDRRPSGLLHHMLRLADGTVSDDIVRTLWLRNLPARVQSILAVTSQLDPHRLAEVADKIMEVDRPLETSTLVSDSAVMQKLISQVADLQSKLTRLAKIVANTTQSRGRSENRRDLSTHRSGSTERGNRTASRAQSPSRVLCFFHKKFGRKAIKCTQPCTWVPDLNHKSPKDLNTNE